MGRAVGGSLAIQARVESAPGLNETDAHALAGFIAAEGCFVIRRNNNGRDWSCTLQVAQRADDEHVLEDIRHCTGLGRVTRLRPQGNSWPLATWTVSSKLECRELVRVLRCAPLRGRKQREFELWADAVELWTHKLYDAGRKAGVDARLEKLCAELIRLRRYVDPPRRVAQLDASDELLWFLGGFFSGEGSFTLNASTARVSVHLRADDRPLLDTLSDTLGLGKVYEYPARPPDRPKARWMVCAQGELERLVTFLERSVLRGRKRREFEAWRAGAEEFIAARRAGRKRDPERISDAAQALRDVRRFVLPEDAPMASHDRHHDARAAYADLLRRWANSINGPLSCTAYVRDRGPHWPTRNTIAAAFGGWDAALIEAGVGDRLTARSARRRAGSPQ